MRVNLILIVLALVLLGAGMLCVLGLNRSAQALLQEAEAAAAALPGDAEAARAHLDAFAARWARTERAWQFIAIHEDIEEISAARGAGGAGAGGHNGGGAGLLAPAGRGGGGAAKRGSLPWEHLLAHFFRKVVRLQSVFRKALRPAENSFFVFLLFIGFWAAHLLYW